MGFKRVLVLVLGVLVGYLVNKIDWQFQQSGWTSTQNITGSLLKFSRNEDFILKAEGENSTSDILKALGWSHAHDRSVQLCLYRLISQGKLSETIHPDSKTFLLDFKSQQLNLLENSLGTFNSLPPEAFKQVEAYIDGINHYLQSNSRPIEFILLNYHPPLFTVIDILMMQKFISFAGLNEISLLVEKVVLEIFRETDQNWIVGDVFKPHLDNMNEELLEIYKSVQESRSLADQSLDDSPKIVNSNNWVVSGKMSKSGLPLMGSDPHMDMIKMPNIFYESHYSSGNLNIFGLSPVGVPVFLFGKTQNISFSITFGMLDMADYFIENIIDKQYERDGKFYLLSERIVEIQGQQIYFYETLDGHFIERSVEASIHPISSGRYLSIKFPLTLEGDIANSEMADFVMETDIRKCMEKVRLNTLGTNFLFADNSGNIGYQQGGLVPLRKSPGLLPLPAWDTENLWRGYVKPEDYHSILNPGEGFIATANNHIQSVGKPIVATFSALPHRVNRITELLKSKEKFDTEDFKRFQSDTFSKLAEQAIPLFAPYLGDSDIEKKLATWDYFITKESEPAAFFTILHENFCRRILAQLFNKERVEKYWKYANYPMRRVIHHIIETGNSSVLTEEVFRDSLSQSLEQYKGETYGDVMQVSFKNIALGGLFPTWTGVNTASYPTDHCIDCVKVGQHKLNTMDEPMFLSQAWRMVTDMSSDVIETILPGGPSGNILSNMYMREIDKWLSGTYKKTTL